MAGTTNNFNSNIALALTAAPQGVYGPQEQQDMNDHFSSTQTLSEILSDAITARVLFLTAVSAGKFVSLISPGTGAEAVGIVAPNFSTKVFGFLKNDVKPGQYAVVWRRGLNKLLTGLIPGEYYEISTNGDIVPAAITNRSKVGFALTPEVLAVDIYNPF